MSGQTTTDIHAALVRMRAGDPQAIDALIGRAYLRLHRLARRQLRGFERVQRFQDADDVVQDACMRLLRRLQVKAPTDPAEFFTWAARPGAAASRPRRRPAGGVIAMGPECPAAGGDSPSAAGLVTGQLTLIGA